MTIAIIKTGGKQYKVAQGDTILIEKIEGKEDDKVIFDEVLFVGDEKKIEIGSPLVKGAKVEGKIIEQTRTKKVTGIKHKPKKRQLKKFGHKQQVTKIEIEKIVAKQ